MHRFVKWRERLSVAPDAASVHAILREYTGSLGPLADTLPPACREALAGHMDVQSVAVTLLQEELAFGGPEDARALLQEVAHTFAAGSVRIASLAERPSLARVQPVPRHA
jgi:hypothetical protein